MNFKQFLTEGKFVVKNKSGKEKRFASADSQEAKDWANSTSKTTVKYPVYSDGYWGTKDVDVYPSDKIASSEITREVIDSLRSGHHIDDKNIDHWSVTAGPSMKVEHTTCATAKISMYVYYSKDDDLGLESDTEDLVHFIIRRDEKNPKKFKFVKSSIF